MQNKDYVRARRSTEDARQHFEYFEELRSKMLYNDILVNTNYIPQNPYKS